MSTGTPINLVSICAGRASQARGVLRSLWIVPVFILVRALEIGCDRNVPPNYDYQSYSGVVLARLADSGRLKVQLARAAEGGSDTRQSLDVFVTHDSEFYLNDRFANLETLAVNDKIRLFGYFDQDDPDQFWVSLAYATRPTPEPPPPALLMPSSAPSSEPVEENPNVMQEHSVRSRP